MTHQLTIQIIGETKTGKTTLAQVIDAALKNHGYDVDVIDQDGDFPYIRPLEILADHKITITMVNINRPVVEKTYR